MKKQYSTTNRLHTTNNHQLTLLQNRVHCITRRHHLFSKKMQNDNLNANAISLREQTQKTSGSKEVSAQSSERKKKMIQNLINEANNHRKENIGQVRPHTQEQIRSLKKQRYLQIKEEQINLNKALKEQKENNLMINRSKRLRVIKLQKRAKQNMEFFLQERREAQAQARMRQKVIPKTMSETKNLAIRMKILKEEEESLNKYEQILLHQWKIAQRLSPESRRNN